MNTVTIAWNLKKKGYADKTIEEYLKRVKLMKTFVFVAGNGKEKQEKLTPREKGDSLPDFPTILN